MEKVKLIDILEGDSTKDVNVIKTTSMYDPLSEEKEIKSALM